MAGAKTIISLLFLAIAIGVAAANGVLSADYLSNLTRSSGILIGLFASILVVLVGVLWGMHDDSEAHIRLWSTQRSFDFPPFVQRLLYAITFACIGLVAFGNRETAMLTSVPGRLALSVSEYCEGKDDEEEQLGAEPEPETEVIEVQGCALIRRAYELGYAKTLGACAPKVIEKKIEAKIERELCTLRQHDEPILHYIWRQASSSMGNVASAATAGSLSESVDDFSTKLDYLDSLLANQAHAVTGSPRSSHHLWTTLPEPERPSWIKRLFVPENCVNKYAEMPLRARWGGGDQRAAAMLDYAWGQMLFNPELDKPPGYCREYTIHWGAPDDACEKLVASPQSFLEEYDALEAVEDVLDRHRRSLQLLELTEKLEQVRLGDPLPDPRRVVSLQCLVVDVNGTGRPTETSVSLGGYLLSARELRTPVLSAQGGAQIDIYSHLGRVLAVGEYSGVVDSRSMTGTSERAPVPGDLAGNDYPLTKLELLREADPFLGNPWALGREDLIDVYPLRHHLTNYIESFRRRYRLQRGRL